MTRYELDVAKLTRALEGRREHRGLSRRQFASEVGVDQALLHRMREGKKPSAEALLTILVYLGADYLPFTRNSGKGKPDQN